MTPFATVEDYKQRYGEVDDEQRLSTLLSDASIFIASQRGFAFDQDDENRAVLLAAITCAVVHRSLASSAYAGFSSVSQGGDGYTASASIYNPGGDFYLTKQERQTLGIGGARIGSVAPRICGYYGSNEQKAGGDAS